MSKVVKTKEELEMERYYKHLEDVGAVEKRTWFSVFVKIAFAVWVFGLIVFIYMWVTSGFQPNAPPFYIPPAKGLPLF